VNKKERGELVVSMVPEKVGRYPKTDSESCRQCQHNMEGGKEEGGKEERKRKKGKRGEGNADGGTDKWMNGWTEEGKKEGERKEDMMDRCGDGWMICRWMDG
jgi:hypothetical protein